MRYYKKDRELVIDNNPKLSELIRKKFKNISEQEIVYRILNKDLDIHTCISCNNPTSFKSISSGYNKSCSLSCAAKTNTNRYKPPSANVIDVTCLNCDIEFQSKEYENRKFCSKKCSCTYMHSSMTDDEKTLHFDRIFETQKERYGDYVINSDYARNKTNDKLGVRYSFQSDAIRKKANDTLVANTGYDNPLLNKDTVDKMIATKIENGTLSWGSYRYKDYKFPSGRIVKIQGYENFAIDELLRCGFIEDDIITEPGRIRELIGNMNYVYEDKDCVYIPDIYIKSINKIIEVKSLHTFLSHKRKNLLKRDAVIINGVDFDFYFYDRYGNKIETYIP